MADRKEEIKKAQRELLRLLSDYPELAARITITIHPNQSSKGEEE